MPKKTPKNSFYFYMKDIQPALLKEGRVFPNGMADVVQIAHPRWKMLPQHEKDRYERMASEYKRRMKGVEGEKYKMDNVGNIIGQRKDPYEEIERKRQAERSEVKAHFPPGRELMNTNFYIIHINTLCKTDDGIILPCEIGLVEYNMKDGVKKHLHRFIDPGPIPSGYRYRCNERSESTHQIPVKDFELADGNLRGLLIQMENFVNPDNEKAVTPPVYCKANDIEDVEMSICRIHAFASIGRACRISKVYELEGLIVDIYGHLDRNMSRSMVSDMLSTNIFDYNSEVLCDWHAEKDVKYCSLGIARRITYIMSDNLSTVYDFPLTRNHLPDRSNIADNISIMYQPKLNDVHSSRSSRSARSTPRSFQDTPSTSHRASPAMFPARSSTTSSVRSSSPPQRFPARDFRYDNNASQVDTISSERDYDTNSDVTLDMSNTRSTTPASATAYDNQRTNSASSGSAQIATWRRGVASIGEPVPSGVGRGKPITQSHDNPYPIAPPGMNIRSVVPPPCPLGLQIVRGRGFAPPKTP